MPAPELRKLFVSEAEQSRENRRHSCHKVFNLHISASTLQLTICEIALPHADGLLETQRPAGGRMKELVRLSPNRDIGVPVGIGKSESKIMRAGQRREIEASSHDRLPVIWWTVELAYG